MWETMHEEERRKQRMKNSLAPCTNGQLQAYQNKTKHIYLHSFNHHIIDLSYFIYIKHLDQQDKQIMYTVSTVQEREIQCGISSYISGSAVQANNITTSESQNALSPTMITGVLKQRYTDFQVYEINTNNEKAYFKELLRRTRNNNNNKTTSSNGPNNRQDVVNDNNKRTRNREKLLRRAKRRRVKATLMWQNRNDFWQRYLCGNKNNAAVATNGGDSINDIAITEEKVNKIANIPNTFNLKWQKYLVHGSQPPYTLSDEQKEALNELESMLGKGSVNEFKCLLHDKSKIVKFPSSNDKNLRRRVHTAIKAFRSFSVLADTIVESGSNEKIVRVRCSASSRPDARSASRKNEKHKFDQRGFKEKWPENQGGEYLHFMLYKENIDTNKALAAIGTLLRIKIKNRLFISGTKDKRAVTIQYVTGYRLKPHEIALVNQRQHGPCGNLWIGSNVKYVEKKTFLGNLIGNEFHIVLRDVQYLGNKTEGNTKKDDAEIIKKVVQNGVDTVISKGFINYFGLQRFGTGNISTYMVGKSILKQEWKKAVDLIMTGGSKERQDISNAREAYRKGEFHQSLRLMPRHMSTETTILRTLKKQEDRADGTSGYDYSAVLRALPRHLTQLYTHAYQSYVWNRLVSERFNSSHHSNKVLVGDLVAVNEFEIDSTSDANSDDNNGDRKNLEEIQCKYLTEEDIENKKYKIDDIVFPLPGKSTKYPQNVYGERMISIMKEDGITLSDLEVAAKVDKSFQGSYRKIIQRATNISFEVKKYKGKHNDELCKTGLEEVINKEKAKKRRDHNNMDEYAIHSTHSNELVNELEEDRFAVVLKFQLPKSTYATMCLREIALTST